MRFLSITLLAACGLALAQEADYPFTVGFNPVTTVQQPVDYQDSNGTSLRGYATYSTMTTGPRPAVVIIPDYDGIGPYELWRAKLLAEMGYVGFVADIYGANQTQGPDLATATRSMLSQSYISNYPLLMQRMYAAFAQVRRTPQADGTKMAVIGYCFGGGAILDIPRAWPSPDLAGVLGVMGFHASPLNPMGGARNVTVGCPIRVSIQEGFDDRANMGNAAAQTLKTELETANVTWEYYDYGQTAHSFTQPQVTGAAASASAAYNMVADMRSWWALRGFLLNTFGVSNPTNFYTIVGQYDWQSAVAAGVAPGAAPAPSVAAALAPAGTRSVAALG